MLILDLGSGSPRHKLKGELLGLSYAGDYVALDSCIDYKPFVLGSIYNLPFRDGCADIVICKDVFEHLANPFVAVAEISRVLKKGGVCHLFAPFLSGYHAAGQRYEDYYRYTRSGLRYLFAEFEEIFIKQTIGYLEACFWMSPMCNLPERLRYFIVGILSRLDKHIHTESVGGWYGLFRKYDQEKQAA